ncbi:hypothetical protein LXA43DRAFT_1088458 [Ganoderma leucocontextum]|nr:hypothetical protein LXA43DRAFT_1088458 [Ganoderma leucocontextum]
MRILDLPYDVWTIILQLASRRDALHLAKASRMTYDIVLPSLLSEVDLHSHFHDLMVLNIDGIGRVQDEVLLAIPSGPEKVTSFSKFILKNEGRDAQHIRTLTIHDTAFNRRPEGSTPSKKDYSPCQFLVDAIVHARNLRHIHIERLESLLENTPSLAAVISGYQQLESISFEAVGRLSLSVLRNLQSTPRSIKLREAGTLALTDILRSLEARAGSLEELTFINYADARLDGYTTVWERVHTLDLVPSHPFPLSPLPALHLPADWGAAKPTQDSLAVRWPNLDSLTVYAPLPLLIPPVRRLLYRQTIGVHESVDDVAKASAAIRRMAPVVLSVWVRGFPYAYLEDLSRSLETVRFLQLSQDRSPADNAELKEHLSTVVRVAPWMI